MIEILTGLNAAFVIINYLIWRKNRKTKFPKWQYYRQGIRFYNKSGEVTIEYDKPLKK